MPEPTPNARQLVVRVLRETALYLQLKGESSFKSRAYDLGADRIAGVSDGELADRVAKGTLEELPGIGTALAQKITELVTTGKLAYFDDLRAEYPPGILELVKVQDVGPKKAQALWKSLGI